MSINPISLLREAIQGADWAKAVDAYAMLTGEQLAVPPPGERPALDRIEAAIWEVRSVLDEQLNLLFSSPAKKPTDKTSAGEPIPNGRWPEANPKKKKIKPANKLKNKPSPKIEPKSLDPGGEDAHLSFSVQPRASLAKLPGQVWGMQNEFADDLSQEQDSISVSETLNNIAKPVARRRPAKTIMAECRGCGKKENVDPIFVYRNDEGDMTYRCNRCVSGMAQK